MEHDDETPCAEAVLTELRERAVRMARDAIAAQDGQTFGVVTRVARQLGIDPESLRNWLHQAEIDAGGRPGTSTRRCPAHRRPRRGEPRAASGQRRLRIWFSFSIDADPETVPFASITRAAVRQEHDGMDVLNRD
jgi:transposase-like protein